VSTEVAPDWDFAMEFPIAHELTAQIWESLDGCRRDVDEIEFIGKGDLRSPFPVVDFASSAFAAAALAVGRLMESGGLDRPRVTIDRRLAAAWFDIPFAPTRFLDATERHGIHSTWMVEFPTADDRWIRVQATYPTLRRRMLQALGVTDENPESVAAALRGMTADEAEDVLVAAGAAVAQARSLDEWRSLPQGRAVAEEPIVSVRTTTSGLADWRPFPERPLHGIRVLDFSRVVAAPMATRFLAALGADVLRIDAPGSDEVMFGRNPGDIMLGKRWALLDARSPEGRARYAELLAGADVMIHSYRPGAIDSLGFDEDERAAIRPGLVEVALDAYGWTGPWRGRRGFDTLLQYASGIADEVARWAREDPGARQPLNSLGRLVDASRPRHLPVEALDFGSGYQVAAAALRGLSRRIETGHGSVSKLSLARSSHLLTSATRPSLETEITLPIEAPFADDQVWSAVGRPSRRIQFPLHIEGAPLFWERPAEPAGASNAVWASTPARWRSAAS
jgi:crotonobetainyl-CoA:carnitine CoA-transferase CaiB-like acyl-CoA transferase